MNKKKAISCMTKKYTLLFCAFFFLICREAYPCTTVCLENNDKKIVATNFDFIEGNGFIFINKQGISKTALESYGNKLQPLMWTSSYGSITFNWWGREFPYTGINEEGLVISSLGLRQSEYPPPGSAPSIFAPQLLQYWLDNFKTIKEIIKNIPEITVIPPLGSLGKLHYFITDKNGDCAVIEYLNGRLICYAQKDLPVKVLTNTEYKTSLKCLKTKSIPVPDHIASIDRFIRTAKALQDQNTEKKQGSVDRAFDILGLTCMGEVTEVEGEKIRSYFATEWSIVYDIDNLKVYYKTFENKKISYFNLSSFDLSCKTQVKMLDIQQDISGDVSNFFIDYKEELNDTFINKARSIIPKLNKDHDKTLKRLMAYPGTTSCTKACQ